MTEYKLEEFINWLETNPAKKLGFSDWQTFCEGKEKYGTFVGWTGKNVAVKLDNLILSPKAREANQRAKIILEWKAEIDQRERERERERDKKIEKLRRKIAKLEAIVNLTPQQEQDLQDKKQKLAELEKEKQQSQNPKKTNWTPWLIGGGIVLVIVIGIIAYFLGKSKSEK